MIVRCTSCNSAFAVDDGKVEDKKFAFTCPKCENENIIDNRTSTAYAAGKPVSVAEARSGSLQAPLKESEKVGDAPTGRDTVLLQEEGQAGADEHTSDVGLPSSDDLLLDDSFMTHDSSVPKANELVLDMPLDDYTSETGPESRKEAAQKSIFEELGDIEEIKSDNELIKDEMEPLSEFKDTDSSLDLPLDEERLLGDEKIIIDEFEHLDDESAASLSVPDKNELNGQEIIAEEVFPKDNTGKDDESITIDLNSLDIDLTEDGEDFIKSESADRPEPDENITIDLDTLDIELQDENKVLAGESHDELDLDISDFSEETIKELEDVPLIKDDENITLDLDSLDIALEESDEIKHGETIDEDEKLTLDDVGLYMDDLTTDELSIVSATPERSAGEDDFSLAIDRMDSSIDINTIEKELQEAESILLETPMPGEALLNDEFKDLPEINFNDDLGIIDALPAQSAKKIIKAEDELIAISDYEKIPSARGGLQKKMPDIVTRGAVNFSIDYSIRYSRAGAMLRLPGLFSLGMLPHFISFFIYTVLSILLGFLNHIIIISTAKNVEDFSEIQENTLRYFLSINASLIGIVEEMPVYAGKDNIDFPLQMRITYPLRYSRIFAFLRLTVIGIVVLTLPHLLILCLLGPFIMFMSILGLFSILIFARWPHALFDFMVRYYRYTARVLAFLVGIVDEYPTFKFI